MAVANIAAEVTTEQGPVSQKEKWEYTVEILRAHRDNKGAKEYLQNRWPDFKLAKFAPETLIPVLNSRGRDGWELVSFESVLLGDNGDVCYRDGHPGDKYSNTYLCTFKRRIS